MTIYAVWENTEFEADLLAMFTTEAAAQEFAQANNGRVLATTVYTTAAEAEADVWGE